MILKLKQFYFSWTAKNTKSAFGERAISVDQRVILSSLRV